MRKKNMRNTIRWNNKTSFYLQRLGLIDGRDGKTKGENLNQFINDCVSMVCESGSDGRVTLSSEELRKAWIRFNVAKKYKEIESLKKEIIEFTDKLPDNKRFEEAMIRVSE